MDKSRRWQSASNSSWPTRSEAAEIEQEMPVENMDLTQAVLEQSRAQFGAQQCLQFPFQQRSFGLSSTSGRAHIGVFFRECHPEYGRAHATSPVLGGGDVGLERQGYHAHPVLGDLGAGDIGFIIWQIAMCLNHMMEENHAAARDSLSLLFVCLEQTAMDNGNMQVGLLLSLQEDPPQSLFTNRSKATAALPRAFAPTAHQTWITTALRRRWT